MLDAELVQDPNDHATDVVAGTVGRRQRVQEQIQRPLLVACIKCRERLAQVRLPARCGLLLELDPRAEAVGGEAAWDSCEQFERVVTLTTLVEDSRERDHGLAARRLKLDGPAQRLLAPVRD